MNFFKKSLWIGMGIAVLAFFGCDNGMNSKQDGNQEKLGGITLDYNTSVYNVSMKDALDSSKDFVNKSVKAQNSKEAFIEPSEEDLWQGFIQNEYGENWNVPSSIYGTSLEAAENELKINGEELGTLQNLVLHKDENGNFICETLPSGQVKVNLKMQTSVEGLFAAGDLRQDAPKQVVCAAADGAIAALGVLSYLEEKRR